MNKIPPITDPLGRNWHQPPLSEIELNHEYAWMSVKTFMDLPEYSSTKPSAVYEGKMWRRHDGIFDRMFLAHGGQPEWLLCWYGESDKPGYVSNNARKIVLTDIADYNIRFDNSVADNGYVQTLTEFVAHQQMKWWIDQEFSL